MTRNFLALLACTCALAGGARAGAADTAAPAAPAPLTAVDSLDVGRYLGDWYEIAHYPNWFQRHCVAATVAHYALLPQGGLEVLNRCRVANGATDSATGAARQVGAADSARLQVRFAPAWLSFLPLVWADYWVIDIDPDYRLVAVSEPRRKYLWILSRTPHVEAKAYQALLARLAAKGFDLALLQLTPQP